MPARPRASKARGPFEPTNPVAALLELIRGRSTAIVYLPDRIERPSYFPSPEDRESFYWQKRDRLLDHWRNTGVRPAAVGEFEPDLGGPGQPGDDAQQRTHSPLTCSFERNPIAERTHDV
ncbi:MAG: hypothetical protein U0Q07_01660 [Acidimicrobiales bacterium]